MQGGIADRGAADEHRRQLGHRCQLAGAAHLHVDGQHGGELFLGRVLVGDSPAWLAGHEAELLLQREVVDLVDHAVDVEAQAVPQATNVCVVRHQFNGPQGPLDQITDRQAPGPQLLEHAEMGLQGRSTLVGRRDLAQAVGEEAQGPAGGDGWVELAHGARCGIARVHEGLFTLGAGRDPGALRLVEPFEIVPAHVDLTANLQHRGRIGGQAQRDLPDGADVVGDILPVFAVTPRGRLHQHAAFVAQAHGQAVEFRLGDILHRWRLGRQCELAPHAGVEVLGAAGLGVGFGADAEHRNPMAHAGEAVQRLAADPLRRRIQRRPLRMARLQGLQFLEQAVVLGVRNGGRVQHVVLVRVVVQRLAQPGHAGLVIVGHGGGLGGHAQARRTGRQSGAPGGAQENRRRASGEPAARSRRSRVS